MNPAPIQLRFVLLLPLLLVACATTSGGSDTSSGAGATSSASGGSGGGIVASLGGAGAGDPNVAGAPAAGASTEGQAGAATAGADAGGSAGAAASSGGAAGGNAGAPSGGSLGNSGSSSGGNASGGTPGVIVQDGIKPYFKTSDTNTTAPISAILGEMHVVNTDGGNATLSKLKVRYYFTNEGTMPMMQMNWAHLKSPGSQLDVPFVATVVKMPTATPTADSYIEFTCNSPYVLDAGKEAEISFRLYDGSNQPIFLQSNDYSFSATSTPSDKIVLTYGDALIWGVAP
jgi:hypothetical protein